MCSKRSHASRKKSCNWSCKRCRSERGLLDWRADSGCNWCWNWPVWAKRTFDSWYRWRNYRNCIYCIWRGGIIKISKNCWRSLEWGYYGICKRWIQSADWWKNSWGTESKHNKPCRSGNWIWNKRTWIRSWIAKKHENKSFGYWQGD